MGGWLEGEGSRGGRIGALLIGYYDDGNLKYAGRVGTGFTEAELDRLARLLAPLATTDSPFADKGLPRDSHFVAPELVAQVRFTEWTEGGRIRIPPTSVSGTTKSAADVRRVERCLCYSAMWNTG